MPTPPSRETLKFASHFASAYYYSDEAPFADSRYLVVEILRYAANDDWKSAFFTLPELLSEDEEIAQVLLDWLDGRPTFDFVWEDIFPSRELLIKHGLLVPTDDGIE